MNFKKKTIIIPFIIVIIVALTIFIGHWGVERKRKTEAIQKAIANPEYIDPGKLLHTIDDSFRNLPESEKKKILNDPILTQTKIANATYKELDKSFKLLFTLPKGIRKKIIKKSADDLRKKALSDPDKVATFFESSAGSGALKGASKFFLLNLSGKQKAESAPLTQAMYEIVKQQAKKKRGQL